MSQLVAEPPKSPHTRSLPWASCSPSVSLPRMRRCLRPLGDVISFCPPLIINRAEIDFLFDAVTRALDRFASELRNEHKRKVA